MSLSALTKAERDIYNLAITGIPNAVIGERLFVTEKTVKFHLTNIYRKLGTTGKPQMIAQSNGRTETELKTDEDNDMADWQPKKTVIPEVRGAAALSMAQVQQTQLQTQNAQEQVEFVLNAFKINDAIENLITMSREVTKGDYSEAKVLAACQCIGRMNETVNTVMKAAQALRGR